MKMPYSHWMDLMMRMMLTEGRGVWLFLRVMTRKQEQMV